MDVQSREISFHNEKNKNFYKLNDQTFKSDWPIKRKTLEKSDEIHYMLIT